MKHELELELTPWQKGIRTYGALRKNPKFTCGPRDEVIPVINPSDRPKMGRILTLPSKATKIHK